MSEHLVRIDGRVIAVARWHSHDGNVLNATATILRPVTTDRFDAVWDELRDAIAGQGTLVAPPDDANTRRLLHRRRDQQ